MNNGDINPVTIQVLCESVKDIQNTLKQERNTYPLKTRWLDINQVCELLRISKRTLQSYRDNGTLSFSQISGKIYFKASDIDELLQKHYKKAYK